MARYDIKAVVHHNLEIGKSYGGLTFEVGMAHFKGQLIEIRELDGFYEERTERHVFSPQMLTVITLVPLCEFLDYQKLKQHLLNGHSIWFPSKVQGGDYMAYGFQRYLHYTDPTFPKTVLDTVEEGPRNRRVQRIELRVQK